MTPAERLRPDSLSGWGQGIGTCGQKDGPRQEAQDRCGASLGPTGTRNTPAACQGEGQGSREGRIDRQAWDQPQPQPHLLTNMRIVSRGHSFRTDERFETPGRDRRGKGQTVSWRASPSGVRPRALGGALLGATAEGAMPGRPAKKSAQAGQTPQPGRLPGGVERRFALRELNRSSRQPPRARLSLGVASTGT